MRILSASHRDLEALVESGDFRQDLYYRLNVINLHVPALRERVEDIPLIAEAVLARLAAEARIERPELTPAALEALCAHAFPGNVRELENVLERALTLCEGTSVEVDDLGLTPAQAQGAQTRGEGGLGDVIDSLTKDAIVQALDETSGNKRAAARLLGIGFGKLRYQMQKLGLD